MERVVKVLLFLFLLASPAIAESTPSPVSMPQTITLAQCIKTFNINFEKLFLLTEVAISANNYTIEEIQSQGGYIVFSVGSYKFLATVFTFGADRAILKISPCNGNYTFPPTIVKNLYNYIETNQYKKF